MKVLIVDDDVLVINGIKKIIPWEELGFTAVYDGSNGEQALKTALVEQPDLIITDIKMPIMDGLEFCKNIRLFMSEVPIILLSAHDLFDYAKTAIKYGVKNYILKPINHESIQDLINAIKEISQEILNRKALFKTIHGDSFSRDIYTALETANCDFINNFFESDIYTLCNTVDNTRNLCLALTNILYGYFETIGINTESLKESKDRTVDDIFNLKTLPGIVSYTYQLYMDVVQFKSRKKDSHADYIAENIKNYIDSNYSDPNLSLSAISEYMNISNAYVSQIFKEIVGINVVTYITKIRIKKACEFLCDLNYKIYDIATMVGFFDVRYFTRVFKRYKGVTPSEYRNTNL